jgi:hypothetical protein
VLGRHGFVGLDEKRLVAARTANRGGFGLDDRRRRDVDGPRGRAAGREVDEPVARADELFVLGSRAPKGRARSNRTLRTCHRKEDSAPQKTSAGTSCHGPRACGRATNVAFLQESSDWRPHGNREPCRAAQARNLSVRIR